VVCEFVAASRKRSAQGFTASNAWSRLAEFLAVLRKVLPTEAVLQRAKALHLTHSVSFWDAMILAACLRTDVDVLYSEDVPGLDVIDLQVINPFK
jgi:predicted nucleic acid-binding protein